MTHAKQIPAALAALLLPAAAAVAQVGQGNDSAGRPVQAQGGTGQADAGADRNTYRGHGSQMGQAGSSSGTAAQAQGQSAQRGQQGESPSRKEDTKRALGIADAGSDAMGSEEQNRNSTSASLLRKLSRANDKEIEFGKLAKDNGGSQAVKDYGDQLIADHRRANQRVKDFASQMNVDLDDGKAEDASMAKAERDELKKMRDQMKGMKGAAFDRAFLQHMVEDHQKDITTVQSAMRQDLKLQPLLAELLPTLQAHEATAKKLLEAGGKPGRAQGRTPEKRTK